jgi:hypothetical protein
MRGPSRAYEGMKPSRREFLSAAAVAGLFGGCAAPGPVQESAPASYDVFVYGSTPGGVAAAIEAARRGCKVLLACPKGHPGGMVSSGLCTTDAVRREIFGGMVVEFVNRVRDEYRRILGPNSPDEKLVKDGWAFEPSVAEKVFADLLDVERERLEYRRNTHLAGATVENGKLTGVELEDSKGARVRVAARTYIDSTYEGDLAAAAKVPYRVGREGREEFGESFAGIHYMDWKTGKQIPTADTGEPSPAIQAFCARCVYTDDADKRIPIEKPESYDQHLPDYLPLLEDFATGRQKGIWGSPIPRRKVWVNGDIEALTSANLPGVSWSWPEANRRHRERLERFHLDHAAGLIWFIQNEPRVPARIRDRWKSMGLHADEFADSGHLPWQIYVRQGRRIEGRARVTQHNFMVDPKTKRTPKIEHAIAIAEHSFDIHPCHDRRYAVNGFMEGVLWYPKKTMGPAQPGQIPYGAMVPVNVDNLLVPVALSSTHIAMSVVRMEAVWMSTGQVAGAAAAVARDQRVNVSTVDAATLPALLKVKIDPYA